MWKGVTVNAMTGEELPQEICPEGEYECKIIDISDVQSSFRGTAYIRVKLLTAAIKTNPGYTLHASLVGSLATLQLMVKVRKAIIGTKCRCDVRHMNRLERTYATVYLRP